MEIVDQFEAARPKLTSLAHRIVGSHHDAEDVVQAAWLRIQSARQTDVDNPDGWFTTITARLCLDLLRSRERRDEVFRPAAELPGEQLAADEEFLRREDVSRALLVLLDRLSPRRRVAYVLHDLFAVPFDQVAAVLGTSTDAAKKLAGRARADLRPAEPARAAVGADHLAIVEAFLAAARGGDIDRLVTLLAPDAVRTADVRLLPRGAATTVRGARAIAEETRYFLDRIAVTTPVFVDGVAGAVIAPGGHPYAVLRFRFREATITEVDITSYAADEAQPVLHGTQIASDPDRWPAPGRATGA
ncbi:sigma-70 family RNA polymerase sigma factor [Nocardia higoensis]|uniref:Sigma-70 family RNA polymerase sigma factor n=1 Tax=Nocardia higoensis TaxID=228599 RepID=A0ABS0DAW8_9NOCA|nr:sigma-70 family RNA polymerase sigma factor [Nocardia higoensis]MBF6354978.1 sigma-70 family RNA polymerase sigma factor [Nocardia higoensis]